MIGRPHDQSVIRMLREIGKALTSTLDVDEILSLIMDYIGRFYRPDDWSLLLVDQSCEELYFALAVGNVSEKIKGKRLPMGHGIAGWAAQQAETVVIRDAYADSRFTPAFDTETGFKTESIVCIPMISKNQTLGVIEIVNVPQGLLDEEAIQTLEALADFAAIAIENARHVRRIEQMSIHDDWTQLYNARHMYTILNEEMERYTVEGKPFSLIFFDMDHFKQVNDRYGHLVGAGLLRKVGDLLLELSRPGDRAVRYGGDEFVLILPNTDKAVALGVAMNLCQALRERVFFEDEGYDIRVTASFGVATVPDDGRSRDEIIKMADTAMYHVKEHDRDGICHAGDPTVIG